VPVGFAMSGLLVVTLSDWSHEVQTPAGVRAVASKTHRAALLIGSVAIVPCALVVWQRVRIAELLFGHGDFPAAGIPVLADTLGCYVAAVPVYLAGLIYTRAFLALQRSGWILLVASTETVLKLVVNWPLLSVWGVPGLAAATGLMYVAGLVVMIVSLDHVARGAARVNGPDAVAGEVP
jgi:peptidoglycan biosynthesis protein MviN/MurJ (putative lipid II flippase)